MENLTKEERIFNKRFFIKEDQIILLNMIQFELLCSNRKIDETDLKIRLLNIERLLTKDIGELAKVLRELIYHNISVKPSS